MNNLDLSVKLTCNFEPTAECSHKHYSLLCATVFYLLYLLKKLMVNMGFSLAKYNLSTAEEENWPV